MNWWSRYVFGYRLRLLDHRFFMNITILTYGSRGDVQPFLPLSIGLMNRGHKVILAAPARFKNLVEEYKITNARVDESCC